MREYDFMRANPTSDGLVTAANVLDNMGAEGWTLHTVLDLGIGQGGLLFVLERPSWQRPQGFRFSTNDLELIVDIFDDFTTACGDADATDKASGMLVLFKAELDRRRERGEV